MKNLLSTIAFLTVLIIISCGRTQDTSTDSETQAKARAGIDSGHHAFLAAMKANDANALVSLLTTDVEFLPPNDSSHAGKEGVRSWFNGIVAQFKTTDVGVNERNVIVGGDWGIERANFNWTLTPVAGGSEITNKGKFIAIWHKEADGTWKTKYNIWNSSIPPPK